METGKYPAWRHHASENPRLVKNEAEEAALGPGWADTPAAFTNSAPDGPAAPIVLDEHVAVLDDSELQYPTSDTPPDDAGSTSVDDKGEPADIHKASASALLEMIPTASEATLRRIRGFEVQHPKYAGGRKGVLKAIDEALQAFKPPTA